MSPNTKHDRVNRFSLRQAGAAGAAFSGTLGLLGFVPGLELLGSVRPDYIPMAPSTAVCFLILSAVLLQSRSFAGGRFDRFAFYLAAFISLFGFLEIVGHLLGADLNFEDRIVPDVGTLGGVPLARMSPSTGLFFFFAGIGVLPLYRNRFGDTHRDIITMTGAVGTLLLLGSLTFLLGYLYGTPLLYAQHIIPMALNTALGFLCIGIALIDAAGKKRFPLSLFTGTSTHARLMRVFLPLAVGPMIAYSIFDQFMPVLFRFNDAWTVALLAAAFSLVTALVVNRIARGIGGRMDRSERELFLNREKYRSLFNSIRDAIVVADPDRKIIDYNPAFTEMFGYSRAEILGNPTVCLYQNEAQFTELGEKIAQNQPDKNFLHTVSYRKKSGEIFPGETNVFYLRDAAGHITGYIGLIRNVADRLASEEKIRQREKRWESLLVNLFDGIVVVDRNGVIRYINPSGLELFGRKKEDMVGRPLGFPVTEARAFEMEILQKDGRERFAHVRVAPIDWEDGSAYLASLRDNTEQRLARQEREQMSDHLQEMQKFEAIGTLAGGIAHDFNNILSPIIGFSEIARDRVKNDSLTQDCLDQVLHAGNRAKDLVNQILSFSRQKKREYLPLQLASSVQEVMKMLRSTLPSTIEIQQNIDCKRIVDGDPTGIHQILMNLCTNAKHAMEDTGGVLSVSLSDITYSDDTQGNEAPKMPSDCAPGDYVLLRVEDTGSGMDPSVLEKVFEPYFSTKKKEKGTGLGLSVVRGIVKDHGGIISVDSRPGKGTRFDVYFPCSEKKEKRPAEEEHPVPRGSEHILLVDDEAPMVKLNRQLLGSLGYRTTTRTSSIEALELFRSRPDDFDMVITDMTMPNLTGDRLAKQCMGIRPGIPTILMTGFSENISEEKARRLGVRSLLYKPISKSELALAVRSALDGKIRKERMHENGKRQSR